MTNAPSPSGYQIHQALSALEMARARLLDEDLGHDEAALTELLAFEEANVDAILDRLLAATVHARDMASMGRHRSEEIIKRAERWSERANTTGTLLFNLLQVLGRRRHEIPEGLASVSQGPKSVFIVDETALPEDYWRVKTERSPDKTKIAKDLKLGVEVPGAVFANGAERINIRTS